MLGLPTIKMGLGFKLPLKWGFPVQSRSISSSPSRLSSNSGRGKEASLNLTRLSFLSVLSEDGDMLYRYPLKICAYSSAIQILENDCSLMETVKVNAGNGSQSGLKHISGVENFAEGQSFTTDTSFRDMGTSKFGLLMENLNMLEKSFDDSDVLKLEKDILLQLGRLGALKLFNSCLSNKTSNIFDLSNVPMDSIGEIKTNDKANSHLDKTVIRTGKKEERRSKREIYSENSSKVASLTLPSKTTQKATIKPTFSSAKKASSKRRRLIIATNEVEMSKGVKMLANLERIRAILEEETGHVISFSCWAEAAGLEEKVLQERLHFGWHCKDELIRSTRSLVLFLSRSYRSFTVPLDDLLQAGYFGVLQGAERFDHTRGYQFSTYVQYWIRKSMLKAVSLHARGIQIPNTVSQAMSKIQKARKALIHSNGKYPDDDEIAKFTGLSLAKIESVSKCQRVVGSTDQKMGECFNGKYLEFVPDESLQNPTEAVMRQHLKKDIHMLLRGLDKRERQVFVLRFGLKDRQPKTLEEIGKHLNVSKEWVRRIEKKVMTRLRKEENFRGLNHYANI